jgi:tetratricopeptide (TPR) repeat protein
MDEFVRLLQRQLTVGSNVKIILKSGQETIGLLTEIGSRYITLEKRGGRPTTLMIDLIGGWEVLDGDAPELATASSPQNVVTPLMGAMFESKTAINPPTNEQSVKSPAQVSQVTPVTPTTGLEPEVLKRMYAIEARFDARNQPSKIEVKAPDFTVPAEELKGQHQREAVTEWGRIKQRYEYAARINELGSQYGRIQTIISDSKTLTESFPAAPSLKRHLAYFLYLSGNVQEALKCYKQAGVLSGASSSPGGAGQVTISPTANDWYNVAALAIKMHNDALACYSLEQAFKYSPISDNTDAWYVYVGLLRKSGNYPLLSKIYEVEGQFIGRNTRNLSQEEEHLLLETCIYLLKCTGKELMALDLLRSWLRGMSARVLTPEAFKWLTGQVSEAYNSVVSELKAAQVAAAELRIAQSTAMIESSTNGENGKKQQASTAPQQLQGYIYTYKIGRNYGFLYGSDGGNYFFHRSAVIDEDLLDRIEELEEPFLRTGEQIPVIFEIAQGPKGPLAVGVSLYRSVDEIFEMAYAYADEGEYARAVTQVKRVLTLDPEYPGAKEVYEKWSEYARVVVVPRGSNPYARAKRALLVEKDLEKAAQLFDVAINENDNTESAIKDLAVLLGRMGHSQEAINVLERNREKITDQQSIDNLLIDIYQKTGQYAQALELLEKSMKNATTRERKAHILWQMANCHLRQDNFANAERLFREVIDLGFDRRAAQRNIALCLVKQQKYADAERILNRILDTSPDAQAAELLEAISKAKATGGQSAQIDAIITETTLTDFSTEISGFTQFFLDRCAFQGVRPERVQEKKFDRFVVGNLEDLATRLGTRNPRERSEYYLSAAKIITMIEEWDDPNQLYKYLCRSFASRGDASVIENRPLDAAREWYCEALSVYDGDRSRSKDEQDAVNALVRYLYATLGVGHVPIRPHIPTIDETLEEILRMHPQREMLFDQITYLMIRSRYAANHLLNRLFARSSFQAMALQYLKSSGIAVPGTGLRQEDFVRLWNELLRKRFDESRTISTELRFIAKVELTTSSVESSLRSIGRIRDTGAHLLFDLDQQRIRQLQKILETMLDLCKQFAFEEQERFCTQIGSLCQDLLREIENSPTKLSVEEIYPIIETTQKKTREHLEEIYAGSIPQLTLRLPEDLELYAPDNNMRIEVQIVVANRMGCSPAESLELVVQEDGDFFTVGAQDLKLDGSLRGGEQKILRVPMRVTEQALLSQAFSLPVYAQYRRRSGETQRTSIENFSIRLYSADQFERIENPYIAHAKGGPVENREMFYGRNELIENVASAIREARTQSKSVVIFGQKRAGKSSILHHLKEALSTDHDLLILDIGNIGSLLDEHSSVPLLYRILWSILTRLEYAIEDEEAKGRSPLNLAFPASRDFYSDPSPLTLFQNIFERFKRSVTKAESWSSVRVVLLIDEFSYIYGQIVNGRISEDFMKNWKALLQANFFSAVLVGQDVMPKFKHRFPNEFGTTQDERVSYLSYEHAVHLIDEPIRIGGKNGESRYREKAIDRIVDLTAGSPFYIQIICSRLVEYMNRKRARLVTEADVEQVKSELIRGTNRLDWGDFDNLVSSGDTAADAISDEDAKKVLSIIAANARTGPCSRNSIVSIASETTDVLDKSITSASSSPGGAPPDRVLYTIDAILDDLVKRDVLECEQGQYYRIRVGLFKEWLIANQ